jgi:hypothetical protein
MDKVFIVAGGWSLKGFDFSRLKGKNVIAVNEACMYVDHDYCMSIDIRLIMENKHLHRRHEAMKGSKVITSHEPTVNHPFDLVVMLSSGCEGFDFRPDRIKTGGNSGYAAINASYHLGAREVYLLGYDLSINGQKYFYGGHECENLTADYTSLNRYYEFMAQDLEGSDFRVYNCSKDSALDVFPKINIDDVL